jgi:hypothetical protein
VNNQKLSGRGYIGVFILIVILSCIGYVGWKITPNLMGYCKKEMRYLTDEEKIDSAIKYVMKSYHPVVEIPKKHEDNDVRMDEHKIHYELAKNPIYYNSIEEFKAINKDCCTLAEDDGSGYRGGFYNRASGGLSTYVLVRYKVRYFDSDNEVKEKNTDLTVAVSNCGMAYIGR